MSNTDKKLNYSLSDDLESIALRLTKSIKNVALPTAVELIISVLKHFHPSLSFEELYEKIRFKGNPSMGFQKSDIERVRFVYNEESNDIYAEVTVNFLSIFGSSSPLPYYYLEMILENSHGDRILQDFLNMFNHRLQRLVYFAWKQHRYYKRFKKDLSDEFSSYILSLIGIDNTLLARYDLKWTKLIPLVGVLARKQKTTEGLRLILSHYFDHKHISIEEGLVSKLDIDESQRTAIGEKNSTLGMNIYTGVHLKTRMIKFRVIFENISWKTLFSFDKNGKKTKEFEQIVRLYIGNAFEFELMVTLKPEMIEPCVLGVEKNFILGLNTWGGSVHKEQRITLAVF